MSVKFKYFIYRNHFWLFALLIVVVTATAIFLYLRGHDWKITFTIIGGALTFVYFIQQQQLGETELFKDLFVSFNHRYDEMNEKLNMIKDKDNLDKDDIAKLYDYFNLCSEEYLFYRTGYIYPEVWKAWCNGMSSYLKNDKVREVWEKEEKSKSYYGLTSREISKGAK